MSRYLVLTLFCSLCWEQNVHVIVMLTREIEGSSMKCGKYWEEGTYGTVRLRLLETNDTPERERQCKESETNGGFFSSHTPQEKPKLKPKADDSATLKRVFELKNSPPPARTVNTVPVPRVAGPERSQQPTRLARPHAPGRRSR